MDKIFDLIIIGGGAAGLTSAIYAQRAGLDFVMLDTASSMGSQLTQTDEVENYTGLGKIGGMDLIMKFREHAALMGANMADEAVGAVSKDDGIFTVTGSKNIYKSKTVIFCAGATHRPLGVKGESEFTGRGVSYCAVCDGFFYKNKTAVIVGGGDTAVSEAIFLSNICSEVKIVHRRGEFRAAKALVDRLNACRNVTQVLNAELAEVKGDKSVTAAVLKDGRELETNGVFVAVGIVPNSGLVKQLADCDKAGFIIADESGKTSCSGLYAAGDVRTKPLRQIITACADGANCVNAVTQLLNS
ncbi:MAG TPA: thioredoxin-disulfide reductase [Ruminococcaceae bacterium]|nr:thioredoxin-disulfide reductase [Oscillospiraceae bacterium]